MAAVARAPDNQRPGMIATETSIEVATVHAIGSLLIALKLASSRKTHDLAIYACAYIATADVLWRMTKSLVFWDLKASFLVVVIKQLQVVVKEIQIGGQIS